MCLLQSLNIIVAIYLFYDTDINLGKNECPTLFFIKLSCFYVNI